MTKKQAEATGLTRGVDPSGQSYCGMDYKDGLLRYVSSAKNDSHTGALVFSSLTGRLVAIYAYPGVRTPEGIEVGSSYAELHRIYPSWQGVGGREPTVNGRGAVAVPGNPKAHYRIEIGRGKVLQLSVESNGGGCYE
jgi:hypothetical protein